MKPRRLQIGMWGGFRPEDWARFGSEQISGMEISQFADREAVLQFRSFCRKEGLIFGIHTPLLGSRGYTLPRLTSPDPDERHEALRTAEKDVELAAESGADYILFHYPFLPIFGEGDQVKYTNLPRQGQRYEPSDLSQTRFLEVSHRLFERLSELQHRYGQKILLEHDFFGSYQDIVVRMFRDYREIDLVVDTARLDVAARIADSFDPYQWLDEVAPSVYLVHYSNVRYAGDRFFNHQPVQPWQDGHSDYGDAQAYLQHLAAHNSRFHVTFEHQAGSLSREELLSLYKQTSCLAGIEAP
ncbi:sugar phosphate isomerase/epimerase family protein [Paenibacillus mucilaginosus]|uniref:Xylose isomerase domain protein TIM barrel n=1 Tax=Paenibacillus mucilaginosus (strain KNP414) TaxID=1036673 RepID=F8FPX8_PAEMK|nr:TIM barrel protein [Paenibacillus mucilaginosus]AEI39120.1 Xylose isomerase domain protein TIM barrel [Paenibacillus mucilaginosus KNP414]MCG7217234.1 TIM barrel protein [Paenibacillus mucilaginosus]WDM28140.1 sugar phosphate isomerase/epimerase [Paenibacillus mucilaginosus]